MKKSLCCLLLFAAFLLSTAGTALAADQSVNFDNGDLFIFDSGSTYTNSDLFGGFKNVMPGDVLTETIDLRNKSRDYEYIRLYLKALPADFDVVYDGTTLTEAEKLLEKQKTDEFLSQLMMKITVGDTLLFEGSPKDMETMNTPIYVGEIHRGKETRVTVELAVPVTLGNEYTAVRCDIDWMFTAECYKEDPHYGPDTGDRGDAFVWILLMVTSAAAAGASVTAGNRRKESNEL